MLKTQAILEIKKGERIYRFELPPDAPVGESHDVLYEMKAWVIERMNADKKVEERNEVMNAEQPAV